MGRRGGPCFRQRVKTKKRQYGDEKLRAYVDLSALYPADPPPETRHDNRSQRKDCGGDHCENEAVREALSGWRWL